MVAEIKVDNDQIFLVEGSFIERINAESLRIGDLLEITLASYKEFEKLKLFTINDISNVILSIAFDCYIESIEFSVLIILENRGSTKFYYSLDLELTKWRNLYSIDEYIAQLQKVAREEYNQGIKLDIEAIEGNCVFDFEINTPDTLEVIHKNIISKIFEVTNTAKAELLENLNKNSIISLFHFPEHVRTYCEQYLIYFTEFLQNVGISASCDLSHEAGQVLFSVTPNSTETALEQIREALNIYLQLPNIISDNYNLSGIAPKEQQLLANIKHFESQLFLANAMIQTQNTNIQNLNFIVTQQQKLIDASILQHSLITTKANNKDEEKEKLIEGAVSLTKFEKYGVEINVANIYRKIKEIIFKK